MANKGRLARLTAVLAKADRWLRRWGLVADLLDLILYLRWVLLFVSTLGGGVFLTWGASVIGLIGGQGFQAITALILITAIGIGAFRVTMPVSSQASGAVSKPKRVTREHDGMEWEYAGRKADPRGPFCLDDHTPLAFVDVRNTGPGPKVVPYYRHDSAHLGGYWGFLQCLTCGRDYGKDDEYGYKTVEQSQNEVRRIFEGMENRSEL